MQGEYSNSTDQGRQSDLDLGTLLLRGNSAINKPPCCHLSPFIRAIKCSMRCGKIRAQAQAAKPPQPSTPKQTLPQASSAVVWR